MRKIIKKLQNQFYRAFVPKVCIMDNTYIYTSTPREITLQWHAKEVIGIGVMNTSSIRSLGLYTGNNFKNKIKQVVYKS